LKLGKIEFVELSEAMMAQCLTNYFFCGIDCAVDFSMSCKDPNAKIFSTFVTKEQHANICVKPRAAELAANQKNMTPKQIQDSKQQCVLRPCSCKAYESVFVKQYGRGEFSRAMKILQGKCAQWCTTGVKPPGVISEKQAMNAIDSMKDKILAGFKWLGNGFVFLGDNIKKGALIVGNGIKDGALIVGKNVKKGALIVGKGFKTGFNAVKGVGKKVGGAFRSVGRRIGRFFRRFRF